MIIFTTKAKVKYQSKNRQRSLLLIIPAATRDALELQHGDEVNLELCVENDKKFVKMYKE